MKNEMKIIGKIIGIFLVVIGTVLYLIDDEVM
jgi:hypothetical protein